MSLTVRGDSAVFRGGRALHGTTRVPGDKSISHRALLFGALAEGRSVVRGLADGDDVARTRAALVSLGVRIDGEEIFGGRGSFAEAERPLDLGNSGTGLRLLAGTLASFAFLSVLVGDSSIHRRPMQRLVEPLRSLGARVDGRAGGSLAPLVVRGGNLHGIDYAPPVPSAQVKGAVLLAGIAASGTTTVREQVATRRHTEELLVLAGADPEIGEIDGRYVVRVRESALTPFELDVPGDPSQAAFLVVAASIVEHSEIVVENVYVGPGRAGFLRVLERMGADVEVASRSETTADLHVRAAPLVATEVHGSEVPSCIDEIPVLAVAAAFAEGTTTFRDASELRAKESDRIATMASELGRIGVEVEPLADGLVVHGRGTAHGSLRAVGAVRSHGDHRVAMALGVAGIAGGADGSLVVEEFGAVATSWPGFAATLERLTAR